MAGSDKVFDTILKAFVLTAMAVCVAGMLVVVRTIWGTDRVMQRYASQVAETDAQMKRINDEAAKYQADLRAIGNCTYPGMTPDQCEPQL